jgi:chaperonin GroES
LKNHSTSKKLSPDELDKDEGIATVETSISIEEILKADNVADLLSDDDLTTISQQVFEDYQNDLQSCSSRLKELKEIIELAMIITKQKSYPWTGASNIVFPLIANACVEFGASCYPEIIKDSQVVKAKVIGNDDGQQMIDSEGLPMENPETGEPIMENIGAKQKRGDRVATAMNYQLLEEQTWWEKDTDKLVHALPCVGDMFKKVYFDPIKEIPISELIFPDKIIVNNAARDIDSAVVTQVIELYPQEIMQRVRAGMFKEFDFEFEDDVSDMIPQDLNTDLQLASGTRINAKLHVFLEQHTWLDLDKDGFPEPYIVTAHSNSGQAVRIIPRFRKEDIKYNKKKEIKDIVAQKYFVHFSFLPSLDGSFFSLGFGHLLLNMNKGINSSINQLMDAGHLKNTGGGFISKGIKMKGGKTALAPGEWRIVDVGGDDLARGIVPLPMPEPSPVMFSLLGALIDAGKQLGSLSDVLSGQNAGNIQATTMISMVEQGLKQFRSIYKRIYKSEKDEFKLLYDLNSFYLTPEKYAEILDEPILEVDVKADFNKRGYDICPVADIDAVTNLQRMATAQFYMTFLQDPFINPIELRKLIFSAVNTEDLDKLIVAPQPQPDPAQAVLQIEQMKNETKNRELDLKTQELIADMEAMRLDLQKKEAEIAKLQTAAMLDVAQAAKVGKETELKEQTEAIKVLDNQIDAQTKQIEVDGRRHDAELKHQIEQQKLKLQVIKMGHEHTQNALKRQHEVEKNSARDRQNASTPQTQE